jgi:hypothetical protein
MFARKFAKSCSKCRISGCLGLNCYAKIEARVARDVNEARGVPSVYGNDLLATGSPWFMLNCIAPSSMNAARICLGPCRHCCHCIGVAAPLQSR